MYLSIGKEIKSLSLFSGGINDSKVSLINLHDYVVISA